MSKNVRISRRAALKGLGTVIALPMLEAMTPALSVAALATKAAPTRMAVLYVPNGAHMADWTPRSVGAGFELPAILEPLKAVRDKLLVLSGLTLDGARAHGDGPGDHARAMASFLTCRHPRKTHGADIKAGTSADQVAAEAIGKNTRFASLELGIDRGMNSGNCDSGYSCAYSANLSWRTESTPMAKEVNPRLVFERLFTGDVRGEADAARAKRARYRMSILDFVTEDAHRLQGRLGANDQRKMDEYLSALRELETRIARTAPTGQPTTAMARPVGIPPSYEEHVRLMLDLLVVAFQGDATRIATFVFANDASNRSYKFIGVPEGHHDLSHHGGSSYKQAQVSKINHFHITQFAYLLSKLQGIQEGDGTLLDHCLIAYGSGISDGNRHNHDNLPVLLAGKGGGTLRPGRHIQYKKDTPLGNLYVSMLERMQVRVDSFGDSTGPLTSLEGDG